jgi:hypothetical protein
MADKVRLRARVVFEWEYDASPEDYQTDEPRAMAEIDRQNLDEDTFSQLALMEAGSPQITVEPVAETIDISGLDKAAVLAALYNHAKPLSLGSAPYRPEDMPIEVARRLIAAASLGTFWDYVHGRVLKVDLSGNALDARLYDLDNGVNAARQALAPLLDARGR